METGFAQPLWITLLGMLVTFFALGLVMGAMILLTRLARQSGPSTEPALDVPPTTPSSVAGEPELAPPAEVAPAEPAPPVDLELPPGVEMAAILAAVVAVATARELAQQRRSARVWLGAQPRSLISPWQLVSRGWQMGRSRR